MADPAELLQFGPPDRLSVASSARSSLPSIIGEGEEGGGEDTWSQSMIGDAVNDMKSEEINWKERYLELEMTLDKFRIQAAKVRDVLKNKLAELEEKVWLAEQKAEEAERKAQVMEQNLSHLKSESTSTVISCCNSTSFSIQHNPECAHNECIISSLEQQIEEQRKLRILDAKQVEDKAARIKEWVTNKLKELEEQNEHLREQNQKCNVQLELLRSRLNQLSLLNLEPPQKLFRARESTEDSSRGSFEEHQESDDSLPAPEFVEYSSLPTAMHHVHPEHSYNETDDCHFHYSPPLPQESDSNVPCPSTLYASVDYSSKKQPSAQSQTSSVPPRIKLGRKKFIPEECLTPSTISTCSEQRYSDIECSSWNRGSSRIDSGSGDGDAINNFYGPDSPLPEYITTAPEDAEILEQRQSLPSVAIQSENLGGVPSELSDEPDNHLFLSKSVSGSSHGCRPLTAPSSMPSNLEEMDSLSVSNHKFNHDKNMLALGNLASTLNAYQNNSFDDDEIHDYAEIYTPSKECSELYTVDGSESAVTDAALIKCGKPPTPPLHRFPSWESRIYEVAVNGINSSTEVPQVPANDSSNNNQCKTLSWDQECTNAAFTELNIPVYATVKGRASQIRPVPFTGDSSDSSDNEETRVTMTTTSSQTTSGDTESSTSLTVGIGENSPVEKKHILYHRVSSIPSPPPHASPVSLSRCRGSEMSPMKAVHREMSNESVLSDDYAVPPDAVSVDAVSIISTDNRPSLTNTPTFCHKTLSSDDARKKEPLEKSGYLTKLGGKFKTWRRRWFVLKNGALSYYKSQADVNRKPQGQIVLDNVCRVNRAEGAATFEISTGKRTYYLTADSIVMMEEWIKVLQNVLRRNATRLLLSKEDNKPAAEGWLTKVKNGHSRRCWCVLIGRMFLYFKTPNDPSPLGQINMRDARVEEVVHVSDSDDEDHDKLNKSEYTIGIFPNHQGPTYLLMDNKQEMDDWMYHLTVVSSGENLIGTQYEQLIAKLMEVDGEENSVIWKHPLLLYSKDPISQPLTTLPSEQLQLDAIKLFKSIQLFISVPLDTSGIEYHVALAQNALLQCLIYPELQNELFCQLIKQTSRHCYQRIGVQQLLICATQSLFLCDTSSSEKTSTSVGSTEKSVPSESKLNPAPFVFVQAWQLLALAVSLFLPKNRTLWYLRTHLQRNANSKLEAGKYAIFCQRALERALMNGGRECKPSRMEVLSILLKNPYHHSLPHSIPVHFLNGTYQVFGFDGSTTVEEFSQTVNRELGIRDCEYSGFALFSDDPIEKDLEHCLLKEAKVCDVISQWEQALRVKHLGKFENTKVLKLTYKNRIILRQNMKAETDKERLLLVYQINQEIMEGKFPLTKELALELAALLAQIEFGDYNENGRANEVITKQPLQLLQVMDQFFPKKFRDSNSDKRFQEIIKDRWVALRGRNTVDCVRIYLNCARKWSFCGGKLFSAKFKCSDYPNVWLAVAENCIAVLDANSMQSLVRYAYSSVMTFGGCKDDFMLVVSSQNSVSGQERNSTERLLFAMAKPKILELTLLIADYMNAVSQNERTAKRDTASTIPSPGGSLSAVYHHERIRTKIHPNSTVSQGSYSTMGSVPLDSSSSVDPAKMTLS